MALSALERLMSRRQIDALIKADPEMIVFNRTEMVLQPDNSRIEGDPTPLEPQEVCFVPFKRRLTESIQNSEFGEIPSIPWVLIGRYDLDVQRGDTFTWQNEHYVVEALDIKKEQHIVAQLEYKGGANRA